MATLSTVAVRDNSTLANFKQWAQVISNFMTTAGWSQSSDTGQVNWGTIGSVPTSGNYVYEIWQPNDGLTNFFLKIEYGTNGTAIPSLRLSIGTSTNGAGTLSGLVAGPFLAPAAATTVTSTTTQWNCFLSGAAGRINVAMWVSETTNPGPIFFGVARSKNSSGTNTSSHVTLATCGGMVNINISNPYGMQTIVFGTGVVNAITPNASSPIPTMPMIGTSLLNNLFASTDVPISPLFPVPGFYDNPIIEMGSAAEGDITDQATFSISAANMPYGASHTFIGFKNSPLSSWRVYKPGGSLSGADALIMVFE